MIRRNQYINSVMIKRNKMRKFIAFYTFTLSNGIHGVGSSDVYVRSDIWTMKNIRELEKELVEAHGYKAVVITGWKKIK